MTLLHRRLFSWPLFFAAALLTGQATSARVAYVASAGTATFEHVVRFINVKGSMAGVTSDLLLDVADLSTASGTVTVPVSNLKTGIGLRDSHAKGESALHAAKYPNVVFTLTALPGGRLVEGQTLSTTATGRLSLKGVTRPISAPVKATWAGSKINVSTQFKFNPHEYGVDYPGSAPSVTVNVTFDLQPK